MPASLTNHDLSLARKFQFRFAAGDSLEFQFPPKVTSDGRSGNWAEQEMRGKEPIATFLTSGPREITITTTYIVDGSSGWDADRIHKQLQKARGFFARVRAANATRNLVCTIKMWQIGGTDPMSCRLTNIGVKYGDTIVGQMDSAFPLRTDLTLDVRLWTKGAAGADGTVEKVQNIPGLRDFENPEWY